MEFESLEISNFLSIGEARVDFHRGVHLIEGVNHDMEDSETEPNGSGKSALMESIQWVLYDCLSRGKDKADSVINRGAGKDCFVKVAFRHSGRRFEVLRTRKHSQHGNSLSLSIDGKDMSQHSLEETKAILARELPIPFDVFRHAVQVGQGLPDKFLDLSETEKQDLLCKIVDLGVYDRALSVSKAKIEEISVRIRMAESVLQSSKDQIQKWKADLQKYEAEYSAFEARTLPEAQSVEETILKIDEEVRKCKAFVLEKEEGIKALSVKVEEAKKTLAHINLTLQADSKQYGALTSKKESLEAEQKRLLSGPPVCPTCKRPMEGKELPKGRLEEISAELDSLLSRLEVGKKRIAELNAKASEWTAYSGRIDSEMRAYSSMVRDSHTRAEDLLKRKEALAHIRSTHEIEKARHVGRIKNTQDTIQTLEKDVPSKQSEIDSMRVASRHWDYWKGIIPNLRSAALTEVLSYLNTRIDHYLMQFSSGAMGMSLRQEAYGSGSKIKVDLRTDGGTYVMSSGGERRRIDLSLYLALSDLVQRSSGVRCNLMVADEIADGLSPAGIRKFLTLLRDKSSTDGTCIFVVTHNPAVRSSFSFDSTLLVEKSGGRATVRTVS